MQSARLKDLANAVDRVNAMVGVPNIPFTPGLLQIGKNYGGFRLEIVTGPRGRVLVPAVPEYRPKLHVFNELQGIIAGLTYRELIDSIRGEQP